MFRYIIIVLTVFYTTFLSGQVVDFQTSNLPIVLIDTDGVPIPNEPKITAGMKVINNGTGQINDILDAPNEYHDFIGIELRGSTSQLFYDKKPYSIELRDDTGQENDVPLLGMPAESDWALIAPLNDKTLIRDMLAYNFGLQVMDWAPRARYVEVVINGSYEGVYMLIERIKRDKNRVDIQKIKTSDTTGVALTGGYILSFDKVNGGFGGDWVLPNAAIDGTQKESWVQVVSPKAEDIKPAQRNYIENTINQFDNDMAQWTPNEPGTPAYENWVDVDSWINYLLVNEITKNVDAYRLSSYFYKNRDSIDTKIHMGPIWDFNIALGLGDYCGGNDYTGWAKDFNEICGGDQWVIHFWWEKICREYTFQQKVKSRWQTLRAGVWKDQALTQMVDSLAQTLAQAQVRNFQRWPVLGQYIWPNAFVGNTYQSEVNYLKTFLLNRAAWMDDNIANVGPVPVRNILGIEGPVSVFPNPVHDGIMMLEYDFPEGTQLSLQLYDISGKFVDEYKELPVGRPMHYDLHLRTLPSGTYRLHIFQNGKNIQVLKVVKI